MVLNYLERIGHDREADQTDHRVCLGFRKALQNLLPDKYPVVVIATAWNLSDVAPDIRMEFIHKVAIMDFLGTLHNFLKCIYIRQSTCFSFRLE